MRGKALFLLMVFPFILNSADVPIIFVHGNKSAAKPLRTDPEDPPYEDENYGLETWYPMKNDGSLEYPTAMTKIIGYQGYDWGVKDDGSPAIDCDMNTELLQGQGTKRVFNFSYYSPDGKNKSLINNRKNIYEKTLDKGIKNVLHYRSRRREMSACKNFMFIHLTPSCPEREEKEEGVFVFKVKERRER